MSYIIANEQAVPFITERAWAYGSRLRDFIGMTVCPWIGVTNEAGKFPLLVNRDTDRLIPSEQLADDGISRGERLHLIPDSGSFSCTPEILEAAISKRELKNWRIRSGVEPRQRAANQLMKQFMLQYENRAATALTTAANWAAGNKVQLSGTDQWSDASSDPISDISAGLEAVRNATGMYPDYILFGPKPLQDFVDHADVVDRYKGVVLGMSPLDIVQKIWPDKVRRAYVGKTIYNAALPGGAPSSVDFWGNHVVMGFNGDNVKPSGENDDWEEMVTHRFFLEYGPEFWGYTPEGNLGEASVVQWSMDDQKMMVESIGSTELIGGYLIEDATAP